MTLSIDGVMTQPLSLPEELILIPLNEETGYFHQVLGWDLNCASSARHSRNCLFYRALTRIGSL